MAIMQGFKELGKETLGFLGQKGGKWKDKVKNSTIYWAQVGQEAVVVAIDNRTGAIVRMKLNEKLQRDIMEYERKTGHTKKLLKSIERKDKKGDKEEIDKAVKNFVDRLKKGKIGKAFGGGAKDVKKIIKNAEGDIERKAYTSKKLQEIEQGKEKLKGSYKAVGDAASHQGWVNLQKNRNVPKKTVIYALKGKGLSDEGIDRALFNAGYGYYEKLREPKPEPESKPKKKKKSDDTTGILSWWEKKKRGIIEGAKKGVDITKEIYSDTKKKKKE